MVAGRRLRHLLMLLLGLISLLLVWACVLFFGSAEARQQLVDDLAQWLAPAPALVQRQGQALSPTPTSIVLPIQRENAPVSAPLPGATAPAPAEQAAPSVAPTLPPTSAEGELIIPELGLVETPTAVRVRSGAWDVAGLGKRVGWLETTGAYPGDARAMEFIGHVSLRAPAGPGPFHDLGKLQPGSKIYYQSGGERYTYRVLQMRAVRPSEVARLYSADGNKLILVTCTSWNFLNQRYDQRLLVSAVLVDVEQK
jgi:LPXTG-site transpeptidase (sortase) family protein